MAGRTRKARTYNRLKKAERAQAAHTEAEAKAVDLFRHELEVKRLDKIAAADRPADWADIKAEAQKRLDQAKAEVDATTAIGEALGQPLNAAAKRERRERVKAQQKDLLTQNLNGFETTMAGHERNLDRLFAVPEAQRGDWLGDTTGTANTAVNEQGQQATWDAAVDYNEKSLDTLEQARDAAQEMLDALGGGTPDPAPAG